MRPFAPGGDTASWTPIAAPSRQSVWTTTT
jgi:hypothetical protein